MAKGKTEKKRVDFEFIHPKRPKPGSSSGKGKKTHKARPRR